MWVYGAAIAVGVILVVFALLPRSNETNYPSTSTSTSKSAVNNSQQKKNSAKVANTVKTDVFTNIFPQKGSYECTYEEVTPSRRTTNTIFFADGKMRGEFRTLGGSSNIMVYDGRYMYIWTEGRGTGTLSVPKSISDFPAIVPKDFTNGTVLGSGTNSASWICHPWAKDASLLQKPSYVNFN